MNNTEENGPLVLFHSAFVRLAQPGVFPGEKSSNAELPPSDQPVALSVRHFLLLLMIDVGGPAQCECHYPDPVS